MAAESEFLTTFMTCIAVAVSSLRALDGRRVSGYPNTMAVQPSKETQAPSDDQIEPTEHNEDG